VNDVTSGTTKEPQKHPAPELTLTHLDTLPTLTPIAVKLLEITSDNDSSAQDVVNALRGDQSLTAKILSVANSAAMGVREKVPTLDRAVVLLGFKAIRSITLAITVFEWLAAEQPARGKRHFDRTEFWKHSLGVACAARRLAAHRSALGIDPEEAFVAGLLHDLGKVALDVVFPKAYERVTAQAEETRADIADCERAILGIDHTVAGRHLVKRWGLPRFLHDVIWLHHVSAKTLTDSVASPGLIALVQLANVFVREQRIGHSGNYAFYEPSTQLAGELGFAEAEIDAISRDVVSDVAEYASLLGLDRETPETLYLRSLTRANAELSRLNTELLSGNRRLTAAARYFKGITQFDRQLSALSDLTAVVAAIADAAVTALQRDQLTAFGVHDQRAAVELCCIGGGQGARESTTERLTEEMREWLQEPGDVIGATIARAPFAVRSMVASVATELGKGECWLLPIVHDEQVIGGIVLVSPRDERAELAPEVEELRSFLASLGLALGRANAQAAARRLSEDLAESNRRLQQMQAEVLRTRALSMIAEMAAGAGHELNGPLTVISGRAQMLMEKVADPELRRSLEQIHNKAHECAQIVTELMDFARPHPPRLGETDLGSLLAEVRDAWLERSALPASRLQVDLPDDSQPADLPQVLVDREQIRRVLDEVLRNAVDAIAENDGAIAIHWRAGAAEPVHVARGAAYAGLSAEPAATRWVEITVRDTGCGMSPAVAQRVFDPFFSHRSAGRGRGLGLARAHRIIEAHGGRIWVTSQPGEGTAFHIMLPQAAGE
jgi:putative nucleotidyltransferase with HDIG domain